MLRHTPVFPTTFVRADGEPLLPNGEPAFALHPLMHPGEPLDIDDTHWRVNSTSTESDAQGVRQVVKLESIYAHEETPT
jgi:hypothetical protein